MGEKIALCCLRQRRAMEEGSDGSGAEHEAAGVSGHLEAVARGVAGAEEHDAEAVAELVDGPIGGAAGSGRDGVQHICGTCDISPSR